MILAKASAYGCATLAGASNPFVATADGYCLVPLNGASCTTVQVVPLLSPSKF